MTQQVDLLPSEVFAARQTREKLATWALVAVAASGVAVIVAWALSTRNAELEYDVATLRATVAASRGWDEQIAPLAQELHIALERQTVADALLGDPAWCAVLSDIAASSGGELRLTDLMITKDLRKTGDASQTVATVSMTGVAASNAEVIGFMHRLAGSAHLAKLELERANMQQSEGGPTTVEFQIRGVAK